MSNNHPSKQNLRDSLNSNRVLLYKLPSNFSTQSIETVSILGTSPTITAVGPYDKFVAAATGGCIVSFPNVFKAHGETITTLKIKVNTLGTTGPVIGVYYLAATDTGDVDSADVYIVLDLKKVFHSGNNPAIIRKPGLLTSTQDITIAQTIPIVSNGDIIEIIITHSIVDCSDSFYVRNQVTGGYILGKTSADFTQDRLANYVQNLGFYLIDGTYTILDCTIEAIIPKKPFVHVVGDSMGRGSVITQTQSLQYKMNQSLYYNTANSCCGGAYIFNIVRVEMQDLIQQSPQLVLIMHYIQLSYRAFESANAGYAAYIAAWDQLVNGIIGIGGRPIFVKMPLWPFPAFNTNPPVDQATCDAWAVFVDQQVVLFPTALVLDLRSYTFTYDASGFHYNDADNTIINNALVELLAANQLLAN